MAEIRNLSALRWGALSCVFCMLATRNQKAVQKGQAIADSYGRPCTAQDGTCQGTECSSGGVGVKNHRQFPKWFLKTTECCGATSAFGNRAWFRFLHCSSGSNTALPHVAPSVPYPGLVPKLWVWTQSSSQYSKHGNKSLDFPVNCYSLPVTAAELPDCNSLPEAPHCPLPKPTRLGFIGQWLLDGKAKVLTASLKSTKWKGNLCLQAEQLWLMKYSMQKPLPFFLKV